MARIDEIKEEIRSVAAAQACVRRFLDRHGHVNDRHDTVNPNVKQVLGLAPLVPKDWLDGTSTIHYVPPMAESIAQSVARGEDAFLLREAATAGTTIQIDHVSQIGRCVLSNSVGGSSCAWFSGSVELIGAIEETPAFRFGGEEGPRGLMGSFLGQPVNLVPGLEHSIMIRLRAEETQLTYWQVANDDEHLLSIQVKEIDLSRAKEIHKEFLGRQDSTVRGLPVPSISEILDENGLILREKPQVVFSRPPVVISLEQA